MTTNDKKELGQSTTQIVKDMTLFETAPVTPTGLTLVAVAKKEDSPPPPPPPTERDSGSSDKAKDKEKDKDKDNTEQQPQKTGEAKDDKPKKTYCN